MQILSNLLFGVVSVIIVTALYSWKINRGQNVNTFWYDIPTWVHRPANTLETDHIKDESPSMRLLTIDSNLY